MSLTSLQRDHWTERQITTKTSSHIWSEWEKSALTNWQLNAAKVVEIEFIKISDYNCLLSIKWQSICDSKKSIVSNKGMPCTQQSRSITYARQRTEYARINGTHSFISSSVAFFFQFQSGFLADLNRLCVCVDNLVVIKRFYSSSIYLCYRFLFFFFYFATNWIAAVRHVIQRCNCAARLK